MQDKYVNKIVHGSSAKILKEFEDNSIDLVLTDPPYFLDKLDNEWSPDEVNSKKNQYAVKSLPSGMKFSREQGVELYKWYYEISKEIYRILKPGGFFFTFSSPRLYHRVASAVDDAGFEIRDSFIWLYSKNQPKAMSLNHIIKRKKNISDRDKEEIMNRLDGWKTPKLKSNFEPIVFGQKPNVNTYLDNVVEHNVGLINTNINVGDEMFPSNVLSTDKIDERIDRLFLVSKPSKEERGEFNTHKTVKPVELCKHLIKLTILSDEGIVLDPFVGSGTTAVAAKELDVNYIGIDINKEYVDIAEKRLDLVDRKKQYCP